MSTGFTEDEMRRALGLDTPTPPAAPASKPEPQLPEITPQPVKAAERAPVKRRGPVLRVTMNVSKEYDGEVPQSTIEQKHQKSGFRLTQLIIYLLPFHADL